MFFLALKCYLSSAEWPMAQCPVYSDLITCCLSLDTTNLLEQVYSFILTEHNE